MDFPFGITVQIRPMVWGARDAKGNRIKTWPEEQYREQPNCALSPRYSNESGGVGEANRVVVGETLYGPYDIALGPHDRVFVGGRLFDVVGKVGRFRNPFTGDEDGSETALVEVSSG